jgi:hypothetical protein
MDYLVTPNGPACKAFEQWDLSMLRYYNGLTRCGLGPTAHPLAMDQRDGISFDRILELYALNGHDIRAVLSE